MTLLALGGGRLAGGCRFPFERVRAASFFQEGRGRSREFARRQPEKLGLKGQGWSRKFGRRKPEKLGFEFGALFGAPFW